jgi:hypothetical protein
MKYKTYDPFARVPPALLLMAGVLQPSPAGEARIPDQTRETIAQAHESLAGGAPAQAADLFEKAASHGEFVDAEVGEVRARLWAGQFRHAVAISNVVAGEHPDSAEAQALLAYIEDRTGYSAQALERLGREDHAHPSALEPVLARLEILIDRHQAVRAAALIDDRIADQGPQIDLCRLRARARTLTAAAPADSACDHIKQGDEGRSRWFELTAPSPAAAGAPLRAGNGLIIERGTRVATLRRLIEGRAATVWVRNFRGELRQAHPEEELRRPDERADPQEADAVVLLKLESAFPSDQSSSEVAPAGVHGLCFSLSYPAAASTDPMLPAVTPCFAFKAQSNAGSMQVNVPLSSTEQGSPVFDAQGRLLGLAVPASEARRTTLSQVPGAGSAAPGPSGVQAAATIPMPELYERLAPAVVQVMVYSR